MSFFKTIKDGDIPSNYYSPLKQKKPVFGKKRKIIVIAGPTGVGKTELSIAIAQILDAEIISADSMQVYRNMDIGTAKATQEQQKKIKHHLIDIKDISENFNISDFYREAHKACREVLAKGKVPIVVGGSGFYIHGFLYGPPLGPPSNPEIRNTLEKQMQDMGCEVLYERLQILDPEYANTITEGDKHKIIRALEIIALTKKKVSDIPKPKLIQNDIYDFRNWFLYYPKEILYPMVEKRCDEMIEGGFLEEVEELQKQSLNDNTSASQAIGYRQGLEYLESDQTEGDFITFVQSFKRASKKYVKRQFTWFKKEPFFRWLNLADIDTERAKEYILQDYEQS